MPPGADVRARHADLVVAQLGEVAAPRPPARRPDRWRGRSVKRPSTSESTTSRSADIRIATCAARMSLSPKVISSVAVVSFSLMIGDDAPVEQLGERAPRVHVLLARRDVEEREQHLRRLHAVLGQQAGVHVVQRALPDRRRGLQLLDRGRADRHPHAAHAERDRAGGDERRRRRRRRGSRRPGGTPRAARRMRTSPASSATSVEPSFTTVRDIYCCATPGYSANATSPISISSPGSNPADSSRLMTPIFFSRSSM